MEAPSSPPMGQLPRRSAREALGSGGGARGRHCEQPRRRQARQGRQGRRRRCELARGATRLTGAVAEHARGGRQQCGEAAGLVVMRRGRLMAEVGELDEVVLGFGEDDPTNINLRTNLKHSKMWKKKSMYRPV